MLWGDLSEAPVYNCFSMLPMDFNSYNSDRHHGTVAIPGSNTSPHFQVPVHIGIHWLIGFVLVSASSIHVALLHSCTERYDGVHNFLWLQPEHLLVEMVQSKAQSMRHRTPDVTRLAITLVNGSHHLICLVVLDEALNWPSGMT